MLERILILLKKAIIMLYNFIKKILMCLKKILLFVLIFFKKLIFIDKNEGDKFSIWDTTKNLAIALVIAVLIRSFLYEPFHIPSGSMKPGLKDGDFIFVSKYDFGYTRYSFPFGFKIFDGRLFFRNKPKRGDVLVFRLPANPKINYIKRLIGLPGDRIQMKSGVLYVNDVVVPKDYIGETLENDDDKNSLAREYKEKLDNGVTFSVLDKFENGNGDDTAVFYVPDNNYFFMGDNRDNSLDSRFRETGFVHEDNLIGKARMIFFSINGNLLKVWDWGNIIRFNRIFKKIK